MAFQKNVTLELTTQWSGQAEFKKLNQALDASARKSDTAGKKMGFFGKQSKNAAVGVRGFGDAVSRATGLLASLGVIGVLNDIKNTGLEFQASERKIKNVADKYGETAKVFEITSQAARELSLGTKEAQQQFGNLFARLRPMKVPLEDLKTLFFGIQKAAIKLDINVEDVNETINQMSQGLASGVIMWEDLDIVTKRFPPLAEALAKVLGDNGVTGSLRDLASQGVITTEVMIAAAQELNKLENLDPSAMRLYQQALSDLKTELGKEVLPVVTEGIRTLTDLANAFREMPDTVQTAILGIAAFGAASAILAPILSGVAFVLVKIGGALALMKGILPIIAGTLGALVPLVGLVKTAFLGLIGVMTGPAGWIAIGVVLTGVIVSMREQIASFVVDTSQVFVELLRSIGGIVTEGGARILDFFNNTLVVPLQQLWANTVNFVQDAWFGVQDFLSNSFSFVSNIFSSVFVTPLTDAWESAIAKMRSAWKGFSSFVSGILDKMFEGIKSVLRDLNIIRGEKGEKPLTLGSTGTPTIIQSLTDFTAENERKEAEERQKEFDKEQKAIEKERKKAETEARKRFQARVNFERQSVQDFDQAQDILERLRTGKKLNITEARRIGQFMERMAQAQDQGIENPMLLGMQISQNAAKRAAQQFGIGALDANARRLVQGGVNATPVPTNAGTITTNGRTIIIETGPVFRQGNQQFVSLDAFNSAVRQAAIAGSRQ